MISIDTNNFVKLLSVSTIAANPKMIRSSTKNRNFKILKRVDMAVGLTFHKVNAS